MKNVGVNEIVQLGIKCKNSMFRYCLMTVTEVKPWGGAMIKKLKKHFALEIKWKIWMFGFLFDFESIGFVICLGPLFFAAAWKVEDDE